MYIGLFLYRCVLNFYQPWNRSPARHHGRPYCTPGSGVVIRCGLIATACTPTRFGWRWPRFFSSLQLPGQCTTPTAKSTNRRNGRPHCCWGWWDFRSLKAPCPLSFLPSTNHANQKYAVCGVRWQRKLQLNPPPAVKSASRKYKNKRTLL